MSTTAARRGRHTIQPEAPLNNLRAIRERSGKTVAEIAAFLGVNPVSVTQAEIKRTTALGKSNWYRLADYFGVDPRVLEGLLPIPEDFVPTSKN